jgi:hypothetical protein
MNSMIRVLSVVVLGLSLLGYARLDAQATNVTGEWLFNVTTDQGGGTPTITFKQDGEKLTGKYAGQLGAADLPVTYDGTVEKNTMKGKLDIGGMVTGTFTATKK